MQKLTVDEIQEQLTKILSSSKLSASNILSQFLYFIVNETLAGRGEALKEYTIAVYALKKSLDFNPQIDSIVRIHAGRLRRALKEYYHEEGVHDPIVIIIPKGNYMPVFELRAEALAAAMVSTGNVESKIEVYAGNENGHHVMSVHDQAPTVRNTQDLQNEFSRSGNENAHFNPEQAQKLNIQFPKQYFPSKHKPAIAVLPFKKIGHGEELKYFTQGMGEYLSTELTLFKNFKVISYFSGQHLSPDNSSIQAIGLTLGADYLITGSVQQFEKLLRLYVQLNNVETGDQLWAHTFERNEQKEELGEFFEEVIERIFAALTGIDGIITRHENSKKIGPAAETYKTNSLVYWYSQYRINFDKPTIQKAKRYYQEIIKNEPENVPALAYLSEILCGEMLLLQKLEDGTLERSLNYARTAIEIDPYSQQGYLALSINHLLSKKFEDCTHTLEQGLELNPKSLDYMSAMGAILIYGGEFERGSKIMFKAIKRNAHLPWWQTLSLGFHAYHEKRYNDALLWADRANRNTIWACLVKAASYGQLNQIEKGKVVLDEMKQQFAFEDLSENGLKNLFCSETILKGIMSGLKKLPYLF